MATVRLTSPAFEDGEPIPRRYGYTEENVNPLLAVDGVPDEAESLALVVDDPDAMGPAGKVWDHWLVWNLDPDTDAIPEDWDTTGAVEGENSCGGRDYGGPNPPDREHTYRFRLYALDSSPDLAAGSTKDELETAIDGRVLAETLLEGT